MIWKFFHFLFKWDYIQWRTTADQGIARVYIDGMGRCFYWRYHKIQVADIIKSPNQVIWLTCKPDKYMEIK